MCSYSIETNKSISMTVLVSPRSLGMLAWLGVIYIATFSKAKTMQAHFSKSESAFQLWWPSKTYQNCKKMHNPYSYLAHLIKNFTLLTNIDNNTPYTHTSCEYIRGAMSPQLFCIFLDSGALKTIIDSQSLLSSNYNLLHHIDDLCIIMSLSGTTSLPIFICTSLIRSWCLAQSCC